MALAIMVWTHFPLIEPAPKSYERHRSIGLRFFQKKVEIMIEPPRLDAPPRLQNKRAGSSFNLLHRHKD